MSGLFGWLFGGPELPPPAPGWGPPPEFENALLDARCEADMATYYSRTLETHLRAHGCEHDFAEVANDGGQTIAGANDPL